MLRHYYEGIDLDMAQARDTLHNLFRVWTRPVNLLTKVEGKGKMLRFDDDGYSDKSAEYPDH
jgi:stage V sporulation protein R